MIRQQFLNRRIMSSVLAAMLSSGLMTLGASQLLASDENTDVDAPKKEGYQSYAYYQGLRPDEMRDASRKDGTSHGMPCIAKDDITAGEERNYNFWHGHDNELHKFTLTPENLEELKSGKSIEVYTDAVEGHRHAVLINVNAKCSI